MNSPDGKRIIKNADELPRWFSLDNYKLLNEFTYDQWLAVISHRYKINQIFQTKILNFKSISRTTPEGELGKPITADDFPVQSYALRPPMATASVNGLSFREAMRLTLNLAPVAGSPQIAQASDPDSVEATQPYDLVLQQADWKSDRNAHVVIDMNASDKQILKDVGIWLKEYREATKYLPASDAHYFDNRHERWKVWCIVPYLDLYLWSEYEGVTGISVVLCILWNDVGKGKALRL